MAPSMLANCLSSYAFSACTTGNAWSSAFSGTYYAAFHWFTNIIPDLRVRVLYPAGAVEFRERFFCLRIPRWSRNRWKAKT